MEKEEITVRIHQNHIDFIRAARVTKLGWKDDPIMRMETKFINRGTYQSDDVKNAAVFEIIGAGNKTLHRLKPMARTTSNKFIYWGVICVDPNDPLPKVTTQN